MVTDHQPFLGKVVLITGGARGIGKSIALRFADLGADVIFNYLQNHAAAKIVQSEIEEKGRRVDCVCGDISRPGTLEALVTKVQEFQRLDVVVHNAALGVFEPLLETSIPHWNLTMNVNARAFLLLAREMRSSLADSKGSLIAVSSLGSHRFIPKYGAIGISKASLENLIRYMAVELAPSGIRVNGISAGLVETDALQLHPNYSELKKEGVLKTPAGRMGTPEDVAKVVTFLAGPEANWIYGQTIIADGGLDLV